MISKLRPSIEVASAILGATIASVIVLLSVHLQLLEERNERRERAYTEFLAAFQHEQDLKDHEGEFKAGLATIELVGSDEVKKAAYLYVAVVWAHYNWKLAEPALLNVQSQSNSEKFGGWWKGEFSGGKKDGEQSRFEKTILTRCGGSAVEYLNSNSGKIIYPFSYSSVEMSVADDGKSIFLWLANSDLWKEHLDEVPRTELLRNGMRNLRFYLLATMQNDIAKSEKSSRSMIFWGMPIMIVITVLALVFHRKGAVEPRSEG